MHRFRYRGVTVDARTNTVPAVLPKTSSAFPLISRGYRGNPAITIVVQPFNPKTQHYNKDNKEKCGIVNDRETDKSENSVKVPINPALYTAVTDSILSSVESCTLDVSHGTINVVYSPV